MGWSMPVVAAVAADWSAGTGGQAPTETSQRLPPHPPGLVGHDWRNGDSWPAAARRCVAAAESLNLLIGERGKKVVHISTLADLLSG